MAGSGKINMQIVKCRRSHTKVLFVKTNVRLTGRGSTYQVCNVIEIKKKIERNGRGRSARLRKKEHIVCKYSKMESSK